MWPQAQDVGTPALGLLCSLGTCGSNSAQARKQQIPDFCYLQGLLSKKPDEQFELYDPWEKSEYDFYAQVIEFYEQDKSREVDIVKVMQRMVDIDIKCNTPINTPIPAANVFINVLQTTLH